MSSHRPYRAYSQACSHRAKTTHKTARSYAGSTLSLETINSWKFGRRRPGVRSILAAGVFESAGRDGTPPATARREQVGAMLETPAYHLQNITSDRTESHQKTSSSEITSQ